MMTKTDAFEGLLGELQEAIEQARDGDRDDLFNVLEDIPTALGILNMRLSKLEPELK